MKVLIVEDDIFSQKLIVSILEKNSIEVMAIGSAMAALAFLEKGEFFDVIVSDVIMPHMDGFTFVRQLHMDNRLNKIPVVLCTVLGDMASLVKGIEAGIAGYIVKPVKEVILVSKLEQVVEDSPGAILVVDDEHLIREVLINTLKRDGYKVLESESGANALDTLEKNKVAMVLADIAMPEMDGFELLANIKDIDATIPVMLISERSKFTKEDVITAGADDFIPRPYHNTEVLAKVRARYKRRRNRI